MAQEYGQITQDEWVSFPGGELEGKRPRVLCSACRDALKREAADRRAQPTGTSRPPRTLCFRCYRADLDRQRAMAPAGQLDTGSEARFQYQLPLEPLDRARLDSLRSARAESRTASIQGIGTYIDRRRLAQIAARHALLAIAEGLRTRQPGTPERHQAMADVLHAAELQLPDAWLPFVVSR
jgi:hypothetical protein